MNKSTIRILVLLSFLFCSLQVIQAQFDPSAGMTGTKAIHSDSSIFVAWAESCIVERGLEDASDSSGNKASYGIDEDAVGKADGAVVSLGDGGIATLTFEVPIANGLGADFAVFENSFSDTYLELAFVEVSSDGRRFVRFPSISNTDTNTQIGGFGVLEASKLYNLAGKYRAFYGTPFDLEELKDSAGLDINNITHLRIIDVIGTIDDSFCSRDSKGNKVNDPYPTAFESGGFDLDAVGVIYNKDNYSSAKEIAKQTIIFPNPVQISQDFLLQFTEDFSFKILDIHGKTTQENHDFSNSYYIKVIQSGVYFINWTTKSGKFGSNKLIVR